MTRRDGLNIAAAFGLATLLVGPGAFAQPAPSPRVRGMIEALDGAVLSVKTREGATAKISLLENARVVAVKNASLADIKANTYVGAAAMPRPDGSQLALEVLIFPEAMRGAGEGHRPWDLLPESTMTNATVAETVSRVDGATLTLAYKEGQKTIVVPPEAPIVTFAPADRSDLKPGAKFMATVTRDPSGAMTAASIVVGRDGVDPPM